VPRQLVVPSLDALPDECLFEILRRRPLLPPIQRGGCCCSALSLSLLVLGEAEAGASRGRARGRRAAGASSWPLGGDELPPEVATCEGAAGVGEGHHGRGGGAAGG